MKNTKAIIETIAAKVFQMSRKFQFGPQNFSYFEEEVSLLFTGLFPPSKN